MPSNCPPVPHRSRELEIPSWCLSPLWLVGLVYCQPSHKCSSSLVPVQVVQVRCDASPLRNYHTGTLHACIVPLALRDVLLHDLKSHWGQARSRLESCLSRLSITVSSRFLAASSLIDSPNRSRGPEYMWRNLKGQFLRYSSKVFEFFKATSTRLGLIGALSWISVSPVAIAFGLSAGAVVAEGPGPSAGGQLFGVIPIVHRGRANFCLPLSSHLAAHTRIQSRRDNQC